MGLLLIIGIVLTFFISGAVALCILVLASVGAMVAGDSGTKGSLVVSSILLIAAFLYVQIYSASTIDNGADGPGGIGLIMMMYGSLGVLFIAACVVIGIWFEIGHFKKKQKSMLNKSGLVS